MGNTDEPSRTDLVTLEEIIAVGPETPLEGTECIECGELEGKFRVAASQADGNDAPEKAKVFRLLASLCSFHLDPGNPAVPYRPMLQIGDRRSSIPEDYRGPQSDALAALAPRINNPGLRARLADTAWLLDRKRQDSGRLAIESYVECVQRLIAGVGRLHEDASEPFSHGALDLLRRALQISRATGFDKPAAEAVKRTIQAVRTLALDAGEAYAFVRVALIDLQHGISLPETIAMESEQLLSREDGTGDPHQTRELWNLAAAAHKRARRTPDADRCAREAAECFVRMANGARTSAMLASGWLAEAIDALRRVPNTRSRREELQAQLVSLQANVRDEMHEISHELDISESVQATIAAISGLPLMTALKRFACLGAPESVADMRANAIRNIQEYPLSNLFTTVVVDAEGKVVQRASAAFGSDDTGESQIRNVMARDSSLLRDLIVSMCIEPARRILAIEHSIFEDDLAVLLVNSPFVPPQRAPLYARGLLAFMHGDSLTAIHLLIPQLENSLRQVLRLRGYDVTIIQSDCTQENRSMSALFETMRAELEKVFGDALVLDLEHVFLYRGGPMLRHSFAHGNLEVGAFYDSDVIYACWLTFHIICRPLLPHWEEVEHVYQQHSGEAERAKSRR